MIRHLTLLFFVMSFGADAESRRVTPDMLKIIGGGIVKPGELTYQVILRTFEVDDELGDQLKCGGAIIEVDHVVLVATAAHCFLKYSNPADWEVIAGIVNYNVPGDEAQVRNVSKIVKHEAHDPATENNDIALIFLVNPFEMTKFVGKVDLPNKVIEDDDQTAVKVSGWGDIYGNRTYPAELRAIRLPVVKANICQDIWNNHPSQNEVITDGMICAGGSENKSACYGDSGGPAVSVDGTLVGIVSHGEETCNPTYPTIFTRVSHFKEWINEAVAKFKTSN